MDVFPSPYSWLSAQNRHVLCVVMLVVTVSLSLYLSSIQNRLRAVLDYGVIELEMPVTKARASELVSRLEHHKLVCEVRRQTLLDYVFLLVYPATLSLLCTVLAGGLDVKTRLIGTAIAWGVLLACPFDAIEN